MSCAVIVVPILAPKITEIACGSVIRFAETNPIVITVVALDDCNTAVTKAPASAPITGFFVKKPRIFFIFSPAAFCKASDMLFIPYKNNASPPINPNKIFTLSFITFPLC